MKLTRRTILIAGASSGIGRAVAEQLADRENTIIITGRRVELLEQVAGAVRAKGSRCLLLRNDATDAVATEVLVAEAIAQAGPIDAALLNIGMGPAYNMERATVGEIDECMALNYDVTVNYLVPLIAHMRGNGGGLITHTNSLAGLMAVPMQGPYSAAKSAVRLLMDTSRIELRGSGIRFLSVYPGFIATAASADDGIPAPFEISEQRAAGYIVKAMESRKRDVAFPWQTAALVRVLRSLPKPLSGAIMLKLAADEY